ncbi:MAG: inorganic phosphate transporter [Alphaproteobacteria bacterium]|nr:inorganic phosphate transporter [Alphaproteobacteria bacterium]
MEQLLNLPLPSLLTLGIVVFTILAFEFINGFHDTANAVATVIYTKTLKPMTAVIWSGLWNFLGAVLSTGAVGYSIIALIPQDILANPGSSISMAMLFAIPLAAITWNLGTWYFGLPASSSHTLIGSMLGVALVHSITTGHFGTGINWAKVQSIGLSLIISPLIGFVLAALILLAMKAVIKNHKLYQPADAHSPPPLPIRLLLIFTCTGVSFAHGSNDGQKGMGLLMIALIAIAPQLYGTDIAHPLIPLWVKATIAVTLGLGTMIGWKRIVVTIGEKIGKSHMSYAQGAAAELVAFATISAADILGLPVSTTHVLSSGVAGTMVANKSGLQMKTVRDIALAWVLTLPVSIFLGSAFFAGCLYLTFAVMGLK